MNLRNPRINNRHGFLDALVATAPVLATHFSDFKSVHDEAYASKGDAFNLVNNVDAFSAAAQTLAALITTGAASKPEVLVLARQLSTSQHCLATLAQIEAYELWLQAGVTLAVEVFNGDTLNPNGVQLDGALLLGAGPRVWFDVKLGLLEPGHLENFRRKIEKDMPGYGVMIDGRTSGSVREMGASLFAKRPQIIEDLKATGRYWDAALGITIRATPRKPGVRFSEQEISPEKTIEGNEAFLLANWEQFTRNSPFVLMIVNPTTAPSSHLTHNVWDEGFRIWREITLATFTNPTDAAKRGGLTGNAMSWEEVAAHLSAVVVTMAHGKNLRCAFVNSKAFYPVDTSLLSKIVSPDLILRL